MTGAGALAADLGSGRSLGRDRQVSAVRGRVGLLADSNLTPTHERHHRRCSSRRRLLTGNISSQVENNDTPAARRAVEMCLHWAGPVPALAVSRNAVLRRLLVGPFHCVPDRIGATDSERSGASPVTPDRGTHFCRLRLPRVRGRCEPAWRRARSITARVKSRGPLCLLSLTYGQALSSAGAPGQSPSARRHAVEHFCFTGIALILCGIGEKRFRSSNRSCRMEQKHAAYRRLGRALLPRLRSVGRALMRRAGL